MRLAGFEPFPPAELKRLPVQKAVNRWKKDGQASDHPRVYCLSNYTLQGIETFLAYHLLKRQVQPDIAFSDYNVVTQTLLDDQSQLFAWPPDFVLLSLDLRNMVSDFHLNRWDADDVAAELLEVLELAHAKVRAPILVTDFVLPLVDDRRAAASLSHKVARLNQALAEFANQHSGRVFLVDLNRIVGLLGEQTALDPAHWHQSKAPFRSPMLSWLARDLATIIGAHLGRSKKCVLLDCDNTLWGGVIGEDGMAGIALDSSSYPGVAYREFQSYLLNLHAQGVLLAICSKNNEADVMEVLDDHPHCLLSRDHFVCIRANWNAKVDSIKDIASTLQLGLGNFVFIDDNPVECGLVEELLPEVDVIQVPTDPAALRHIWHAENIFFTPHRTREDRQKLQQYRDNEKRRAGATTFTDLTSYLRSLETSVEVFQDDSAGVERIAQLTQKTNQFNLRTQRYSVPDIERFIASDQHRVFTMDVRDRFGEMGTTNVCIIDLDGAGGAFVDTFLMSCRVIKRDLEFYFLRHCLRVLRDEAGVQRLRAEYIPSPKNALVEGLWDQVGLQRQSTDADGGEIYGGGIDSLKLPPADHIQTREPSR